MYFLTHATSGWKSVNVGVVVAVAVGVVVVVAVVVAVVLVVSVVVAEVVGVVTWQSWNPPLCANSIMRLSVAAEAAHELPS